MKLKENGEQQAYSEWYRVLKKDGVLFNFDANWYDHLFDEKKRQAYEEDRKIVAKAHIDDHYTCTDIDAMENIARQVPLSGINRPDWDREILTKIGFTTINIIPDIWQQVWSDEEKSDRGTGKNKKTAEQAAAKSLCKKLGVKIHEAL